MRMHTPNISVSGLAYEMFDGVEPSEIKSTPIVSN